MRVLGYVRVSTEEQRLSGASLEAQRNAIAAECERRGEQLLDVVEDVGLSGKDLKRPGVQAALEELRRGEADALIVAKLDRLSRSMLDSPPSWPRHRGRRGRSSPWTSTSTPRLRPARRWRTSWQPSRILSVV